MDGRLFEKFVAAGTYFLRKYRSELNDLNVFPVPDGDTGSNMYLTARAALAEAKKHRDKPLSEVAAAAAHGGLLGARGNSGVIFSQLLRGFAHNVRHRPSIDTVDIALAFKEAVGTARLALVKPVEGTIISVASAAADEAYRSSLKEHDIVRMAASIVRAAAEALERTPDQLPVLKEAGVVDSGGAGLVYFLEGILRFLPEATTRATAFPRRPGRKRAFTTKQKVNENKFCTEFVLEDATIEVHALRDALVPRGESLLVAGEPPILKVHLHTSDPHGVEALVAKHGKVTRWKVDDMERQHNLLVVDRPTARAGVVAVVPGDGFASIARELGAERTVLALDGNPSVRELVVAINASLAETVFVLANDPNVALAAREAAELAGPTAIVVATRDVPSGLAAQIAIANALDAEAALPDADALLAAAAKIASAGVFFSGKDTNFGGVTLARGAPAATVGKQVLAAASLAEVAEAALREMGAADGGLATLYYGGVQKERDARALVERLTGAFDSSLDIEYYYGGQRALEYVISLER